MENNVTYAGGLICFLLLACVISYTGVNWVRNAIILVPFLFHSHYYKWLGDVQNKG